MFEERTNMRLTAMVCLLGLLWFAYVLSYLWGGEEGVPPIAPSASGDPWWPFTPQLEAQLAQSPGFDVLIAYTDNGFNPPHIALSRGQSVRFINNSSQDLWVASAPVGGGAVYRGHPSACGQSAFDSCAVLRPKQFWEFTFEDVGTWGYRNNVRPEQIGVLRVEDTIPGQ